MYEEEGAQKPNAVKLDRTSSSIEMIVKEMIDIIVEAGYVVKKREPGGCGYPPPMSLFYEEFFMRK